jgi:3'-phosphoadenosine 5'-phosphosulfate sulfotransferase (PAPS reductase)/FAD synthetase
VGDRLAFIGKAYLMTTKPAPAAVIHYGGGRQTAAMLVLVKRGLLPKPDRIVIADTGRENPSTWDYREEITEPLAQSMGLTIEIAPRSLAYVDLYSHQGELLIPAYTKTGKLSAFCSTEWKQRVVRRYLKGQHGITSATAWIGYALDERKRYKPNEEDISGPWYRSFPLMELSLTKRDCVQVLEDFGLPVPPPSACWMCPNKPNEEWRYLRDNYPAAFEQACALDEDIRDEDIAQGHEGVWLHHSRVALRAADLEAEDRAGPARQCGLGMCFV